MTCLMKVTPRKRQLQGLIGLSLLHAASQCVCLITGTSFLKRTELPFPCSFSACCPWLSSAPMSQLRPGLSTGSQPPLPLLPTAQALLETHTPGERRCPLLRYMDSLLGEPLFLPGLGGGVACDLLAFMAGGRLLWQDSWLHPRCLFACKLGAHPHRPLLPSCTEKFARLGAHVASFLTSCQWPPPPAEPRTQPCSLPRLIPQARFELESWKMGWDPPAKRGFGIWGQAWDC